MVTQNPDRAHKHLRDARVFISPWEACEFWEDTAKLGQIERWTEEDYVEWAKVLRYHFGREVLRRLAKDHGLKIVVKHGFLRRDSR